jgi:hypothetical protein
VSVTLEESVFSAIALMEVKTACAWSRIFCELYELNGRQETREVHEVGVWRVDSVWTEIDCLEGIPG